MKNVIHIIVDALREDCINKEIDGINLTPNLNYLGKYGLSFSNYFANGAPTEMALASIFSSTLPLDYGGYSKGMSNRPIYLQEILKQYGYSTEGIFISRPVENFPRGYDYLRSSMTCYHFCKVLLFKTGKELFKKLKYRECLIDDYIIEIFDGLIEEFRKLSIGKLFVKIYKYNKKFFVLSESIKHCLVGIVNLFLERVGVNKQFSTKFIKNVMKIDPAYLNMKYIIENYNVDWDDGYASANKILNMIFPSIKSKMCNKYIFLHLMDVHESRYCSYDINNLTEIKREMGEAALYKKHFKNLGYIDKEIDYFLSIMYIDKAIGRLLDFVKKENLLAETIFIVSADHGKIKFSGRDGKHVASDFFDELYKVPLYIYDNGIHKGQVKRLCSAIDFAPTLLGLLGIEKPTEFKGNDILKFSHQNDILEIVQMEHTGRGCCDPFNKVINIAIRNKEMKLVYKDKLFECDSYPIVYEVYDLLQDPEELHNLSHDKSILTNIKALLSIAEERMSQIKEYYHNA